MNGDRLALTMINLFYPTKSPNFLITFVKLLFIKSENLSFTIFNQYSQEAIPSNLVVNFTQIRGAVHSDIDCILDSANHERNNIFSFRVVFAKAKFTYWTCQVSLNVKKLSDKSIPFA